MTTSKPKIFMGWQEIDSALDMGQSAVMAVRHFEEKYRQKVETITCHPESLQIVRSAVPSAEVYVDPYIFAPTHLNLYGATDATHEEGEIHDRNIREGTEST